MKTSKFIFGLFDNKAERAINLSLVDNPSHSLNDLRAFVRNHSESAYAMFPEDYFVAWKEIDATTNHWEKIGLDHVISREEVEVVA